MLCDKCKKNEATVHIKEFHDGACRTMHLCNECARRKDSELPLGEQNDLGVNLAEVLFNIEKFAKTVQAAPPGQPEGGKDAELACPKCHWTASMIKDSGGKLGCPECYRTFGKMISDAIARIQRGTIHLGKRPGGNAGADSPARINAELRHLQADLRRMIAGEEYEAAAVCRDRISELREQLARTGSGGAEQ